MFSKITESSTARYALTNKEYNHLKKMAGAKDAITRFNRPIGGTWPDNLQWITTDNIQQTNKSQTSSKTTTNVTLPSDTAFLQYTSGSTSEPKGVMITHGNLAHNLTIITRELKAKDDTVVVSWLPQVRYNIRTTVTVYCIMFVTFYEIQFTHTMMFVLHFYLGFVCGCVGVRVRVRVSLYLVSRYGLDWIILRCYILFWIRILHVSIIILTTADVMD
jgi:long-subunit acyl-CoA synthetase (AMP-forming)